MNDQIENSERVDQTGHFPETDIDTNSDFASQKQSVSSFGGLEDLPVQLEVRLAEIDVSLAKFRTLTTGVTVPLDINLSARMDITANGVIFGNGTLVQIGDRIGIQIEKWQAEPEH